MKKQLWEMTCEEAMGLISETPCACQGATALALPLEQIKGEPETIVFGKMTKAAEAYMFFGSDGILHGFGLVLNKVIALYGVSQEYRAMGIEQQMSDIAIENGASLPSRVSNFSRGVLAAVHESAVRNAVKQNKNVPDRVLREHPNLFDRVSNYPVKQLRKNELRENESLYNGLKSICPMKA